MEQTLGHRAHYKNMRATIDADTSVRVTWYPLTFPPRGTLETLPPLRGNWTARSSLRAWRTLNHHHATTRHEALFFHTQVPTLLCAGIMRRVPTVVSLDATPRNYDAVGAAYGHQASGSLVEELKRRLNRRTLHTAAALITWCDWARRSLIADYGVDEARITVIPPGVPLDRWSNPAPRAATGPVRILFVGADFERKGGELLLHAFNTGLREHAELHLVTKAPMEAGPGIHVYRNISPNSDQLLGLYAAADIFVLPTLADCFPLAIQEAMAAGLPVVATDVGAISEAVRDGETGLLVPAGDLRSLSAALHALVGDAVKRQTMGRHGRVIAEQQYDSGANARRILGIMIELARGTPQDRR